MQLSPEGREQVANELKRFAGDLNLTDEQKDKVQNFLSQSYESLQEYKKQNPNASKEDVIRKISDNRAEVRQKLVNFLSPEQLKKWDAEVAKVKDVIGQRAASA